VIPPSPLRQSLLPRLVEGRLGHCQLQKEVLSAAGVWLPNARAELERIERDFEIVRPAVVVPNAPDPSFAWAHPARFVQETGFQDFILCAARIEPRKNQLALLKAASGLGRPVVLMGRIQSPGYWKACLMAKGVDLYHMEESPPEMVASAMAAAAVHVLPSWYETPGLASLEAALAGCQVVTTDRGTAREYFQDLVYYCDPASIDSIREAIRKALSSPPDPALREHVAHNFTWEAAARATLEGYRRLLKNLF